MPPATAEDASDAGSVRAPLDAALDAQSTLDAAVMRVDCLTPDGGITCDDGVFCNGSERCEPAAPNADARGCVSTGAVTCSPGEMCSERMRGCSLCSDDTLDDGDGDGHEAMSCGGDDCRDDEATTYPGASEICNGKDDNCDGVVDGEAATAACVVAAPTRSTSSCVSGSCQITCDDPDADLVSGACVQHDDCAGVTACSPGTCLDGVRVYTCSCPTGYSGTTACTDIDECANSSDCDSSPAACVNELGTYHCACPDTHRGDGKGEHGCLRKAIVVAAGSGNTCAVMSGGRVKCWGDNSYGKLGVTGTALGTAAGQLGDALPFVGLRTGAVSIAAGSDVTCAVLADGAAKCWGYNDYGACGGPGPNGLGAYDAPLPSGRTAVSVAAGSGYGFAQLGDGSIGYWGAQFATFAGVVPTTERVKSFDRSPVYNQYHVCALMESGVVRCWPSYPYDVFNNVDGTLGPNFNAALPAQGAPIDFGGGRRVRQISAGNQFSCALLDDDNIKCWGRNDLGQLGLGDTVSRGVTSAQMGDALPVVPLGAPVKAIASGASHSCAILNTGAVKCWGRNDAGQLGQGGTDNIGDAPGELASMPAVDLGAGRTALAIDVGTHSCALLDDGSIKCWGTNANGELGQGDTATRGAAPGTMGDALKAIDLGE